MWDQEGCIGKWRNGRQQLTVEFQAFRGTLGVAVKLCAPADPEAKGMVERTHDYYERSFLPGRSFESVADFHAQFTGLRRANMRVHATTKQRPADAILEDRGAMLPFPAVLPDPSDPDVPHVAAVCVYPSMVAPVKKALTGSGVKVAAVATGFPSGQTFREIKVQETRQTVAAGADEIDMVIDRGAFLSGDYQRVFDEIAEVKEACGPAHLKVILETGELANYDQVRKASLIAMYAGADFIKTSTGKVGVNATLPVTLVMLEAIRDFHHATGKRIGMKPAGGISNAKLALAYLVVLYETLGAEWMSPDMFRIGASSLLNDILMQHAVPVIFITAFPERLLTGERPEPTFLVTTPFTPDMVKALISQALFFDEGSRAAA